MEDFGGTLKRAQAADADAFAAIWREFHPGLLRYLRVKSGAAADDLAADTWMRVVRALPTFVGDADNFQAWVFTMGRNRLTDWYRMSARRRESLNDGASLTLLASSSDVESMAEEHAGTDDALRLIRILPPDQAEAVMLRVVSGLDVAAVARIMDRSPGSVRVLCHRGLKTLERHLRSEQGVPVAPAVGDGGFTLPGVRVATELMQHV